MGGAVTVKVYKKDGYPAKRVKVKGYYGGGLLGEYPTQEVKTDNDGRCILSWDGDYKRLVSILIAGERHNAKYQAGETFTFTTNRA